jgi:hypothetical protein
MWTVPITSELAEHGIHRQALSRLIAAGRLERVGLRDGRAGRGAGGPDGLIRQEAHAQAQWMAFLTRNRLAATSLDEVLVKIRGLVSDPLRLAAAR